MQSAVQPCKKLNLIIYDTANKERSIIQPFIDTFDKKWNVTYTSIDKIMDIDLENVDPARTHSVFFIFGIEFLKGLQSASPLANKIVNLVKKYEMQQNKLIGLSFPSMSVSTDTNLVQNFSPIFESIYTPSNYKFNQMMSTTKYGDSNNVPQNERAFIFATNKFLSKPLESRTLKYHTTLSLPHYGSIFFSKQMQQILAKNRNFLKFLPENIKLSDPINETMPFCLYFTNKKNHILIMQNSLLAFSGITENCHFCPMQFELRKELLGAMETTFTQATDIYFTANKFIDLTPTSTASNQNHLNKICKNSKSKSNTLRKTAWMEINLFAETGQPKLELQKQLISHIINSKMDTLWISICPNCFYSPIAIQKNKEHQMLVALSNFTLQLKIACQKNSSNPPKILIGFEIANNLYNANLPHVVARDVYGNSYKDIPDPLNLDFWKNEIEIPLTKFVEQWNKPKIGNGIKLSGIMIDLEMYGRKSSGIFLTTMGISQDNLSEFFKEQNIQLGHTTASEIINYLMANKLSEKYFCFLENKAKSLGNKLRTLFEQQIPNCIIALYMPNILVSWFYKGLYKGICTTNSPLHLFSFNSEFNNHKRWFSDNNINVRHSSVLLLSKLSSSENFKLAKNILDSHDGFWLNRFSRLVEKRSNDWTAVEKPMFPENSRAKLTNDFIQYLGNL